MDQAQPVQDLDIIALLTRPGTYVLAVIVFIIVLFIRRIVENIWPNLKKQHDENSPKATYLTAPSRWWNTVILAALPVAIGAVSSFMKSDFFFDGIGDKGGRIAFGAGDGGIGCLRQRVRWNHCRHRLAGQVGYWLKGGAAVSTHMVEAAIRGARVVNLNRSALRARQRQF